MKQRDGYYWFGYFNGMEYYPEINEPFEQYLNYHNVLSKNDIIQHIEHLEPALAAFSSFDIFTGDLLPCAGMYIDGDFLFPTDFLHYYKSYNIGIPPEYERYLIERVGLSAGGSI